MARRKSGQRDGDPRWDSDLPPAPGDLRIVQAFVNTADRRAGSDLASPRALADWLGLWGLAPRGTQISAGDLERALEMREALRALLGANRGAAVSDAAVARLDSVAEAATLRVRFGSGGRARFEPASEGLDGALAHLCRIVAAAQLEGTWSRLKACADKTCRAAFFDFSKNRSGKWCTARCGNRTSALSYRRRNLETIRAIDAAAAWARRRRRARS